MSENDFSALCDPQKLMDFIYDDIDDSEIFARGPTSSSEETESKSGKTSGIADEQKEELIQENETLKESLENLKKEKEILQLRISELYKTAKAELERKDRRLKDLEKEKDSILFRRAKNFHQRQLGIDKPAPIVKEVPKENNENLTNYRIPKKKIVPETQKSSNTCNIGDSNDNNSFNVDQSKVLQDTEIAQGNRYVSDVNRENEHVKVTRCIEDKYNKDYRSKETHGPRKHNEVKSSIPTRLIRKGPRTPSKEREQEPLPNRPERSKSNEDKSRLKEAKRPPSPPTQKEHINVFRRKSGSPSNDYRHSCFEANKLNQKNPSPSRTKQTIEDHLRRPSSPAEEYVPPETSRSENSKSQYQRSRSRDDLQRSRFNCRSTHFAGDKQDTFNKVESKPDHRSKSRDGNSEDHRRNRARFSSKDKETIDLNPYNRSKSRDREAKDYRRRRSRSSSRHKDEIDDQRDLHPNDRSKSSDRLPSEHPKNYSRRRQSRSASRGKDATDVRQDLNPSNRSKSRDRQPRDHPKDISRRRQSRSSSRDKDATDVRQDLNPNNRSKSRDRQPRDNTKDYSRRKPSRSSSRDKDVTDVRRDLNPNNRSKSRDRQPRDHTKDYSRRRQSRSSSRDKDAKDVGQDLIPNNRSKSRGRQPREPTKDYSRRRQSRSSSRDKDATDVRQDLNPNNRSKSRDRQPRDPTKDYSRRRQSRSSSRDKDATDVRQDLNSNNRSKSRDKDAIDDRLKHSSKDSKNKDSKFLDLREKCSRTGRERQKSKPGFRRSRSASNDRFSKRSPERDRYGVRQRNKVRNDGNKRRSRSNSRERVARDRFSDKNEQFIRRDRFGNIIQDKYKGNRNRSKSRERLRYRSGNSRPRDIGTLRERLLRYSMERDRQGVKRAFTPDSKQTGNNRDRKIASGDNDADFSDLDDLKLHLSGESDIESLNAKEKRDEALYSDLDDEVDLLKDLGLNVDEMTDEQLERLIEEKKKHLVKEGASTDQVVHNSNARFSGEEDNLSEGEIVDDFETKNKRNYFLDKHFVEELDYEVSQDGIFTDKVNHQRKKEVYRGRGTENEINDNIRSGISSRNDEPRSNVDNRYDKLNRRDKDKFSDNQTDRGHFKTLFDARQQRKTLDNNQTRDQTKKMPQINRRNTEATGDKFVNTMKEDREKFRNRQQKEDIEKTRRYTSNERNKLEKSKEEGYKSILEQVEKIKQGCSATSMEVESIKSQAFKKFDSIEKKGSKSPSLEEVVQEGKDVDKNQTEVVKVEETKKKEKISFSAYRARRQSTEQRSTETEVIDSGNCETNVPIENLNETDLPTNNNSEINSINNEKHSENAQSEENYPSEIEHVDTKNDADQNISTKTDRQSEQHFDLNKTPEEFKTNNAEIKVNCPSEIEHVDIKNDTDQNISTKSNEQSEQHFDLNKTPEGFQSNNSNAENLTDTAENKLQESETMKDPESNQAVVIDDTSSVLEISDLQSKQDNVTSVNNSCNDKNSFLHDLSISDDDDDYEEPVSNRNICTGSKEVPPETRTDKIRILSNITIQSPSYTPPLPKSSTGTAEETSKNTVPIAEPKSPKKSRRSLFQITDLETLEAVKNITENVNETKCISHSALQNEPGNSLQISENATNKLENSSLASDPHLLKETPEYVKEIEAEMSHLIGNSSIHNSPKATSNQSKGALNAEELQKCLEEDIGKANEQIINGKDKKEVTHHSPLKSDKSNKKTSLIKDNARELRNKKMDNKKVIKRQSKRQKNIKADSPPPVEKQEDLNREALLERLFGTMTPSPWKPSEEPPKETTLNLGKVKRNLMKEVCSSSNWGNFKLRDKNDKDKNKSTTNKKADIDNNAKTKPKKKVGRNRSKSVDVKEFQNVSVRLEKSDPCVSEETEEKKAAVNLPNFCSNPTYIPSLPNKQSIFESPNHYIMKKNKEHIKNRPPNIDRNSPFKKHNLSNNSVDQPIESFESTSSSTHESYILEDEDTYKNSSSTKQPTKKQISPKKKQLEDIDEVTGKNKTKKIEKKVVKQTKKNLTKNVQIETRKNNKTPSFKIRFNRSRKKNKKESEEELSDSSDFEDTNFKYDAKEKQLKIQEIVNKVKNKKREREENQKASEESESDTEKIKPVTKKVKPNKETKAKPETSKPRKGRNINKKKQQKEKAVKEQICDKIEAETVEISEENTENNEIDLRKKSKETKHVGISKENAEKMELDQIKELKQVKISEKSSDKKKLDQTKETKGKHTPESNKTVTVSNATIQKQESLKIIKRITPQRIGDSSIKQKDARVKRELFTDSSNFESNSTKRNRSNSSTEEIRPQKMKRVTYTESMETVESEMMDNAAHTSIKVQENHLEFTVSSNQSPLPNIEQIYEAYSKNSKTNNPPATEEDIPVTSEDKEPRVVELHIAETSFPELNLDTKDLAFLSDTQKEIFFNLSAFNLSDKSLGADSKNKSDSGEGNTANASEKDLSFSNFLRTSTPFKDSESAVGKNVVIESNSSENVVTNNKQQKLTSASSTASLQCDKPIQTLPSSSAVAGSDSTGTAVSLKPSTNVNVSENKTSSEVTSVVSSNSNNSKRYARFSEPLKRDRRRPISVRFID